MLRVALVGIGDLGKHHARASKTLAAEGCLPWSAICARDLGRIATFRGELDVGDAVLRHRAPRKAPVAVAFEAENPYAAQLRDFLDRITRHLQGSS